MAAKLKIDRNLVVRKRTNKDRSTGKRSSKKRYSLWKAETNKSWQKRDKETLEFVCVKYDLDPDTFIVREDEPRDLWGNAVHRATEYLKVNNWFKNTSRGSKREQVERIKRWKKGNEDDKST